MLPGRSADRPDRQAAASFGSRPVDRAVAQLAQPLTPDTVIAYEQGYLDAHFTYPIAMRVSDAGRLPPAPALSGEANACCHCLARDRCHEAVAPPRSVGDVTLSRATVRE